MQAPLQYLVGLGVAVMLAGCVETTPRSRPQPIERQATLTGTVTYRERIALPPGAVVEVKLVDATAAGTPGVAVAANEFQPTGQVPLSFSLTYDPSRLLANRRYAVQARILVDGKPWMVAGTVNHLMEGGRITHAEIILQPAQRTPR